MADVADVQSGLEGVIAFATEIAEPDREGGALRYRGVDIEDLVGQVPFEKVWGLLVDGSFDPGLPPAVPHPLSIRTGDPRADLQAALATLAPEWGLKPVIDISEEQAREDLAKVSVMALSFVAQSARGGGQLPVPQSEVDKATSIPERFLIRWRGEADPRHVAAIDASRGVKGTGDVGNASAPCRQQVFGHRAGATAIIGEFSGARMAAIRRMRLPICKRLDPLTTRPMNGG